MSGRTWASRLSSTPASRRAEAERGPSRTSYLDLMKTTTRWTSRIILNAEPASKSWPTPGLTLGDRPTTRPQLVLYFYLRYFTWWNTRVNTIFIPVHIQDWTDQPHCLMRTCSYRPRWLPWPPAPPRSSCSRSSTSELFHPYLSHNLRLMPLLPLCTRISYPTKEFIFAFFYDSFDFHVRLHFLRSAWLLHLVLYCDGVYNSYASLVIGWCICLLLRPRWPPWSPVPPRSSWSRSSTSEPEYPCLSHNLRSVS